MSTDRENHIGQSRNAYLALVIGVLSVSTGAIFVRYAQQEAASLTIATYRMGIAFGCVLIYNLIFHRQELRSLSRRDLRLTLLSGLFLAIHFAAWIYSLELSSVAVSVVLVNTAPLWVGLLAPSIARERIAIATMMGVSAAVVGMVLICWGEIEF